MALARDEKKYAIREEKGFFSKNVVLS